MTRETNGGTGPRRPVAGAEESAEVERWVLELTGRAEPRQRTASGWRRVCEAVVPRILEATSWPDVEGSPWLRLDEIVHRSLAPGAAPRRAALDHTAASAAARERRDGR